MKRNYTVENPRNQTTKLMRQLENKALCEKICAMKSNVNNNKPMKPIHIRKNQKAKLQKQQEIETINKFNHNLLERMFTIFTRKRPEEKGFNTSGRVSRYPKHELYSLNYQNRREQIQRINKQNNIILRQLSNVKPRVIKKEQWVQHSNNCSKLKDIICYYNDRRKSLGSQGRNTWYSKSGNNFYGMNGQDARISSNSLRPQNFLNQTYDYGNYRSHSQFNQERPQTAYIATSDKGLGQVEYVPTFTEEGQAQNSCMVNQDSFESLEQETLDTTQNNPDLIQQALQFQDQKRPFSQGKPSYLDRVVRIPRQIQKK